MSKLIDLHRILHDTTVPMSTRQTAQKKYEDELKAGVEEFAKHLESLRCKYSNEEKSSQQVFANSML